MTTAKKLKEEYERNLKDLQNKCSHNNVSKWMEHSWAPAHYSGFQLKQCIRCWKIIKYKTNCIACRKEIISDKKINAYQNNCLCDKCLKNGKYYCTAHKKFYDDPQGCPECIKCFDEIKR